MLLLNGVSSMSVVGAFDNYDLGEVLITLYFNYVSYADASLHT